ncbi:hypothetical protein [Winogradskyella sediminis]|nr:hypothetical protein [Winogradskyella sediminis]REG89899.1 hypothetical protein C8N41_1011145 [Winogradskyella sediminis]
MNIDVFRLQVKSPILMRDGTLLTVSLMLPNDGSLEVYKLS